MAYNSTSCALSDDEISVRDLTNRRPDVIVHESNDSEITFCECLKIFFKPKYQPRKLKNKGAILVLVWNFFVTTVIFYLYYKSFTSDPEDYSSCTICDQLIPIPAGLVMLFAGWLADVYFERYKVLRWSIIIMWISSLLLTTTYVLEEIVTFTNYYQLVFLASMGIGFGMFQVNIIQFGIDQLTDASTDEIVSFINWYVWSYFSAAVVTNFACECTSPQYSFIAPLMLSTALSVVASSLFLCNKVLIKEPVTQNPFKLIYRVLKYALKHKYARQRSAFTYCEDYVPSRIDFGKSKYGGPFTTEQVEDVKTFFRSLVFVFIVSSMFGIRGESVFRKLILRNSLIDSGDTFSHGGYAYTVILMNLGYIAMALIIPFNEIIIHPLFQRCLPHISCHRKIVLGVILQVVRYTVMIVFVTLSRQHYLKMNKTNDNVNASLFCIFNNNFDSSNFDISATVYDYRFYIIPDLIAICSFTMIFIGAIEFLCAQIPYSMKGIIVGLFYGSFVVFFALNIGAITIFRTTSSLWSADTLISCGFWYLQTKLLIILSAFLFLILWSVLYKRRKREDVLPNEHIFAERYYSKKLQQINL